MTRLRIAIGLVLAACAAATPPASAAPDATSATASSPTPIGTTALPNGARIEDLAAQFRYDASAALGVREASSSKTGGVAVSDIEYANGRGGTAKATLLAPEGTSRRPALVMVAGSNQSRSELSGEALGLANELGAVVLVVDQSQLAMRRDRIWTFTAQDREEAIETVVDVRRGIDLLLARTDVDAARIGLHGFSYGAWLVAMTGAIDARATMIVLRSGGPQILREIAGTSRAADPSFARYLDVMATVDQSRYAAAIAPSTPVLVQNGTADTTYSADAMRAWQNAVAGAKTARMYEGAGHTLSAAADAERISFLRERWRRAP